MALVNASWRICLCGGGLGVHVLDQLLGGNLPSRDDVGLGPLAGPHVGDADDGGVGHGGVAAQQGLELGRGDLEPVDLDELLDPVDRSGRG